MGWMAREEGMRRWLPHCFLFFLLLRIVVVCLVELSSNWGVGGGSPSVAEDARTDSGTGDFQRRSPIR